ncbi:MAG: AtpZ/AtpI family protein [Acidobacteriota bacterium]
MKKKITRLNEKENSDFNKKKLAAYSTLGLMFPASIVVGLFIGYFLDEIFNTSPVLLIIFTLYGIAAGFYNFFKIIKKYDKREK